MSIGKALIAVMEKHTGRCASAEEIEWRNSVCHECPKRRPPKGKLENTLVRLEGDPGSTVLGDVCDVCSCSLGLLNTATENSVPNDPKELAQRPDGCWIHTIIS